ncbi:MAG: glutamate--tRNA ligase [Rhodospirillales bacterium]|nr:glutamate--tRNA ligase [Alphaproteobacteria bacterium]USO06489.1 MAG: glutamate--tRNA ligase [Rhodospirillales bacterium]
MSVKVRFAPSPTGMLHVGNARTALMTWLFARSQGGRFLLRIDDTDPERSKVEYELAIEDSLMWLGLNWDEKANQKDRLARYQEQIAKLQEAGRIYPCYETPEELGLMRKTLLSRSKPPIYDRAALSLTDAQIAKYEAEGRRPHWRFKLNHEPIEWNDHIRGEVKFNGSDLSDPVVIREDGSPLYHLCSVIDDIDFDITHIIRGEDHVSNTATHIQMFEALGAVPPEFAHNALISDAEGGKLSKRLGSLSIRDLRETEGLEAMAVSSLLARLGTSDPIEAFTSLEPLVESFDFSKFSRASAKFDPAEIFRLNAKIIHDTPFEAVNVRLAEMGLPDLDEEFWEAVKANLEKIGDIQDWWSVANGPVQPVIEEPEFIAQALSLLPETPWSPETWGQWTKAVKEDTGRKGKALFMPLRQAITGMDHGPELDKLLLLIGPDKVKERLSAKKAA